MPIFSKNETEILFIHIPKCAGTSVEKKLKSVYQHFNLHSCTMSELPCTPQHFHASLLPIAVKKLKTIESFAIVRNPLLRIISEYFWRNRHRAKRGDERLEPNKHIINLISAYKIVKYVIDNHIRHQIAFILPKTKVFYLENGIQDALDFASNAIGYTKEKNADEPNSNNSKAEEIYLTRETINKVEEFYQVDYAMFNYKKLAFSGNKIAYSEIKKIVKSDFENTEYVYNADILKAYKSSERKWNNKRALLLRDEAIKIETVSLESALLLIKEANKLKPYSKIIKSKLSLYEKKLVETYKNK